MIYRLKQFIWAVFSKPDDEDIKFVYKYLDKREREYFFKLKPFQQKHSIKVAKNVLDECLKRNLYDIILIKASLLHDIGKIQGRYNFFTNSIIVLAQKTMPHLFEKFSNKKLIYIYINHPEIGASYLKGDNDYLVYLIRNHHNYSIKGDEKLSLLQLSDSKY